MINKKPKILNCEFSLDELVENAARLIEAFVPKQERYKVTDYPDARTVRFYTTRGLMDKPNRYNGQNAMYGSKHLLQLVIIKYLQSQYLSIRKIDEIISGLTQDDLLKLINHPQKENLKSAYLRLLSQNVKSSSKRSSNLSKSQTINGEQAWNRYEIEPGFEVHIRGDFSPESQSHLEVLANRVRVILKHIKR